MCFSTEASLIAWTISIIIAIYLWRRNRKYDRWNAAFICSFAMIQLWEAGIWFNGVENTDLWVKLIAITLATQPLVQTMGAYYSTDKPQLLGIASLLYAFILLITVCYTLIYKYSATVGSNGHLVWKSPVSIPLLPIIYLIGLFLGLFYAMPEMLPLLLVGIGTLLFSISRVSTGEIGSYWCYTAVAYSIVAVNF